MVQLIYYLFCNLDEKDEVMRYCDRILSRCHTVELTIKTNRNLQQEEALHQVKMIFTFIILKLHIFRKYCLIIAGQCSY